MLTKNERKKRVLARGEFSNHCHVITGDIEFDNQGRIVVCENSNAVLKHILETAWLEEGKEIWTREHKDIKLEPGVYEFIQQQQFDPLEQRIRAVAD